MILREASASPQSLSPGVSSAILVIVECPGIERNTSTDRFCGQLGGSSEYWDEIEAAAFIKACGPRHPPDIAQAIEQSSPTSLDHMPRHQRLRLR
jgi:hypothetical protein